MSDKFAIELELEAAGEVEKLATFRKAIDALAGDEVGMRVFAIRALTRYHGIISNGDKEWPLYLRLCEKMPPADAMKRALKGEE